MMAVTYDHLPDDAAAAADDHEPPQQSPPQVVCFGELLVDFVPMVAGLALCDVPGFKAAPGGAPANVAVGIRKLGVPAAFIGKLGDDDFGYSLVNVLKRNGVDTRGVRFDSRARTGLAFVSLSSDGERQFMFYRNPSADMLMVPEELDHELITSAKIFHYGSISLTAEPCRSTHFEAMKIAKEAGLLLSYDPNLRLPLWSSPEAAREGIMSVWDQADIIKVSEEEVKFLTSTECLTSTSDAKFDAAVLNHLWHSNLKLLLVTDGAHGCHYFTPNFKGRVASLKVSVVDTTGAGDAFVAGILTKLVQDVSMFKDEACLREALRFANACGAITTTQRGAIPALPDAESVMRLMSEATAESLPPS